MNILLKKNKILGIIFSLFILIFGIILFNYHKFNNNNLENIEQYDKNYDQIEIANSLQDSSLKIEPYILRAHNGKVFVFKIGNETPLHETEIKFNELAELDKMLLQNGIQATTYEQIQEYIEDYVS
ncbi:MAG: hypothetical protein NkDv07_0366 [Candidatus Improbicoccus devescovinae]|nr:MAG: hypothetical protein NkDv07_0366 [Candidatus Improbicoccus devescovinae]